MDPVSIILEYWHVFLSGIFLIAGFFGFIIMRLLKDPDSPEVISNQNEQFIQDTIQNTQESINSSVESSNNHQNTAATHEQKASELLDSVKPPEPTKPSNIPSDIPIEDIDARFNNRNKNSKSPLILFLFILIAAPLFAGGFVKTGQSFTPSEDIRWFTKQESIDLLKDLEELDQLRISISQYKQNESLYKQAAEEQKHAIISYKASIENLESALKQAQALINSLQSLVQVQVESIKQLTQTVLQVKNNQRSSNRKNFFTGFLAPIAGAWGLSRIK